jgi:hypothetical protein
MLGNLGNMRGLTFVADARARHMPPRHALARHLQKSWALLDAPQPCIHPKHLGARGRWTWPPRAWRRAGTWQLAVGGRLAGSWRASAAAGGWEGARSGAARVANVAPACCAAQGQSLGGPAGPRQDEVLPRRLGDGRGSLLNLIMVSCSKTSGLTLLASPGHGRCGQRHGGSRGTALQAQQLQRRLQARRDGGRGSRPASLGL